jgi:hypothetical protein
MNKIKRYFNKLNSEIPLNIISEHSKIYRQVYPIGHIKKGEDIIIIFPYNIKLLISSKWDKDEYIELLKKQVNSSELQTIISILKQNENNC